MANKLRKIELITRPNGYTLDVNDDSYMYFTEQELFEGFVFHVGLDESKMCDREERNAVIEAAVAWKDKGDLIKELLECKEKVESLQSANKNLKERVKKLEENKKRRG